MSSMRAAPVLSSLVLLLGVVITGCGGSSSSGGNPTATSSGKAASLGLINPGVFTVGTDATYPPMESVQPGTSKIIGADPDLAQAIAKAMGLKQAKLVNNPFPTIIPSLQRHRFDVIMSSMNDTPERRKQIGFVDYMRASEAMVVTKSSGIHADQYSQMCGKTVAVQSSTTELAGLQDANKSCSSQIAIKQYSADTDAFQAFKSGHADAYTGDLPVAAGYVKQDSSSLTLAGKPFGAGQDYGIGFLKQNTKLKAALTAAVAKVRSSGAYAKILKKWGVGGASL